MKEYFLHIVVNEETEEVIKISEKFISSEKLSEDPFNYLLDPSPSDGANTVKKKKKNEILQSK